MGSYVEGSKNPTTQTNALKFVEEVATKIMQAYKVAELFQTMAIVSLNMGNLTLEMNTLKKKLATGEKEKAII
jgi:hypothetical protein